MVFVVIVIVAILVIGCLAVREIVQFVRKRTAYSLRRLTLRLSMAAMLLFLFASVLVGVRIFELETPDAYPRHWLAFWGCVTLLTGAILCLVLADLRLLQEENRSDTSQYWREIAETIADYELHRKP